MNANGNEKNEKKKESRIKGNKIDWMEGGSNTMTGKSEKMKVK